MRQRAASAALALVALPLVAQGEASSPAFPLRSPFDPQAMVPAAAEQPLTPELYALGRRLFHEPRLSADGALSCASCHRPELGFSDGLPRALGDTRLRNTPPLYNRAFGHAFGWDGKAPTLEAQVLLPIANQHEMNLPLADAVARLRSDAGYVREFTAVLGAAPDEAGLGAALGGYLRGIVLGDSPVDRFFRNQRNSLTREERAGLWIYESKGRCWRCHVQPNFSDEKFHNTGVGVVDGEPGDLGRFLVTQKDADRGAFKTPTLRGLTLTAPYMHDGSLATLEDVVAFYRRGGNANPWLSPQLEPLALTDDDARHLVAFLRALSRVEPPQERSR